MKRPDLATSILRFVNGRNDSSAYLNAQIGYITDDTKTDGGKLVETQGCSRENPLGDMLMNKRFHHQTHGKQGVHFVLSCLPSGSSGSPNDILQLTREIVATVYPDFLAVMAVHTDSRMLHSHVVLDAVNAVTGRKFSQGPGDLNRVKQKANTILKEHGFEIIRMSTNDFVDYSDHSDAEDFEYLELDESVLITEQDMKAVSLNVEVANGPIYDNVCGGCLWPSPQQLFILGGNAMTITTHEDYDAHQPIEETGLTLTEQAVPAAFNATAPAFPTTTVVTGPTLHIKGNANSNFSGLGELMGDLFSQAQEYQQESANLALAMQKKAQDGGFPTNVSIIAGPVFDIDLTAPLRTYGPMIGDDGEEID